jgi:hypothetical protein
LGILVESQVLIAGLSNAGFADPGRGAALHYCAPQAPLRGYSSRLRLITMSPF